MKNPKVKITTMENFPIKSDTHLTKKKNKQYLNILKTIDVKMEITKEQILKSQLLSFKFKMEDSLNKKRDVVVDTKRIINDIETYIRKMENTNK